MCFLADTQMRWTTCLHDDNLALADNLEQKTDTVLKSC